MGRCQPRGCRAHVLRREGVQQLGDGIVVAALPVPAGPAHAVLPVPWPLPQAAPHLLQDLQGLPCRQLLRESWVSAKPGAAAAGPGAIPWDTLGGMSGLSPSPQPRQQQAAPQQGRQPVSQCHSPKPTHSMNRLTCSAGSWKSPSNSSRAHCGGGAGVEHGDPHPVAPRTPSPSPGEGKAVLGLAAELRLPAGSSWGCILPMARCQAVAGGGNGKGRQRSQYLLAGCWG